MERSVEREGHKGFSCHRFFSRVLCLMPNLSSLSHKHIAAPSLSHLAFQTLRTNILLFPSFPLPPLVYNLYHFVRRDRAHNIARPPHGEQQYSAAAPCLD